MWQTLYEELSPKGLEIVTVALDLAGNDAVRQFIEAAKPTHPSLIDRAHVTDELLGFYNVPMAVWIDEEGMLVQPAHVSQVQGGNITGDKPIPDDVPPETRLAIETVRKIPRTAAQYLPALRDWAEHGSESRFARTPDEVVAQSDERPAAHAEAAACFELGQHIWLAGDADGAVLWFKKAHALHPENWTYKRQAWTLATTPSGSAASDLRQAPSKVYDGDWMTDVLASGPENYYPPLHLERK